MHWCISIFTKLSSVIKITAQCGVVLTNVAAIINVLLSAQVLERSASSSTRGLGA